MEWTKENQKDFSNAARDNIKRQKVKEKLQNEKIAKKELLSAFKNNKQISVTFHLKDYGKVS